MSDTELKAKGYGTIGSQELAGQTLNIDNYWRKQNNPFWQSGFAVHWEDYFQPKDKFMFSPLPNNIASVEGAVLGLLLFKMWKDRPETFERIAIKYLDSLSKICTALINGTKVHPLSSIHGTTVFAAVAHKLGLIDNGGYEKIVDESRNMISVLQQQVTANMAIEGLTTLVEGAAEAPKGLETLSHVKAVKE